MNLSDWQRIEDAVARAAELSLEERAAWLDEYCVGDDEVRREIESLLAFESEAEGFLEKSFAPLAASVLDGDAGESPGGLFGKYKSVCEIGRGGMGTVFLAERTDGEFEHQVALKIVRQTVLDSETENHFRRERQILAKLNHPSIARLLDGGVSEKGEPFLVMEYVEGERITVFAEREDLSIEDRLQLFLKVCSAVAFAHRNLVVHRDIKPSNILVRNDGEPVLLDFGLAKILELDDDPTQTATAFRALTPAYASPEQLRGDSVTTASDIYSLAVVLYELLTGERPYRFKSNSFDDIVRAISTDEPTKPSLAEKSDLQSTIRSTRLKGDLDNIVLKALRKEPEHRYGSAEEFAADIERHLNGLPVTARPHTLGYRVGKFITRNKIGVAAAAIALLAIVAGSVIALWQANVARRQRDAAQAEKRKADEISRFLSAAFAYSDPMSTIAGAKNRRDATINQMLDDFAPRIESEIAEPDIRSSLQRTVGLAYLSQLRYAEAERYLNAALDTELQIYGENHQQTAFTLSGLATLQGVKGDYPGAENLFNRSIAVYRAQPPTDQTDIKVFASALVSLGDVLWTKGDYNAAESAYAESLSVSGPLPNGDREPVADANLGIGLTRYSQGRLDEAETMLRQAAEEYRSSPHLRWKLPVALNALGQVLLWANQFDKSLAVLRESEAISLEVLGENSVAFTRGIWLQVYPLAFKGELEAASRVLEKAFDLNNRFYPENKITRGANLLDARCVVLTRSGNAEAGEAAGRGAVEMYLASMPPGTPSVTLARIHLAESLIAQSKFVEAEAILQQAYKDASAMQGVEHWRTKDVESRLTALRQSQ